MAWTLVRCNTAIWTGDPSQFVQRYDASELTTPMLDRENAVVFYGTSAVEYLFAADGPLRGPPLDYRWRYDLRTLPASTRIRPVPHGYCHSPQLIYHHRKFSPNLREPSKEVKPCQGRQPKS
ncbi:MAG: hypothetical protein L0Z07_08695, partial [Planctomycetes bacterium]|nr:hypothetical protein [Planctomycetota bacterium]